MRAPERESGRKRERAGERGRGKVGERGRERARVEERGKGRVGDRGREGRQRAGEGERT